MYDAIVLAGGSGRRLGGLDKANLEVDGLTLLDRALSAVATADRRIVVGPVRSLPEDVIPTREQPAGGGPLAALAAGLEHVAAETVIVLACDMPFVDATTVAGLLSALDADARQSRLEGQDSDGAQLLDDEGQPQPLAAAYRTRRLRSAVSSLQPVENTPMRRLAARLRMLEVAAGAARAWDCDTWSDLERARRHARTLDRDPAPDPDLGPEPLARPIPGRNDVEEA